jgi:uncharacterized pyridoxal phosphate-dependent enzyme
MISYQELNIKPIINACTTMTYLGGSLMPDEVTSAMVEASHSFVNIRELHQKVGDHIAQLTKNEAAYVTTGCAAAIVLSLLGIKTQGDHQKIELLAQDPQTDEVLVQNTHTIPYFPAISLAKCQAVYVGSESSVTREEFISKISENTIATLFVAGSHLNQGGLDIKSVIEICKPRGIKVIVDAAAQLPPVENLWKFTKEMGADVALFSGGKALLGPQSSGLMVGVKDIIEWSKAVGAPNQTLARSMKVGKEEIMGLAAAIERYVQLDHEAQWNLWSNRVDYWVNELREHENLVVERSELNEAGQPVPRCLVMVKNTHGKNPEGVLLENSPSIAVLANDESSFWISPDLLTENEVKIVAEAIRSNFA